MYQPGVYCLPKQEVVSFHWLPHSNDKKNVSKQIFSLRESLLRAYEQMKVVNNTYSCNLTNLTSIFYKMIQLVVNVENPYIKSDSLSQQNGTRTYHFLYCFIKSLDLTWVKVLLTRQECVVGGSSGRVVVAG